VHWDGVSQRTGLGQPDQEDQGGGISGRAIFDGTVSVRSLGAEGVGPTETITTLGYALDEVRGYDLFVGGKELVSARDRQLAAAALAGQEAFVRVDARGQVQSIAYHRATPASTRELLRRMVEMMRVTLAAEPGDKTWTAREPTPNGLAHVRYEDQGEVLLRTRLSYDGLPSLGGPDEVNQQLSSHGRIEVSRAGRLQSIDDREALSVEGPKGNLESRWIFRATLANSDTFDVASAQRGDLDEVSGEEHLALERQRGLDEQLSRDWNLGTIEVELLLDGQGKHLDPKFVAQAAAFTRLHPEACDHLVAWFEDPQLSDLGRQLTLDVLSATGSTEAQGAMRRAVQSRAVTLSPSLRGALVQRFVFVAHPDPESARFVADVYDKARAAGQTEVSFPAAAALGAIIDHMEGSDALAQELDARLRRDLDQRRSADESVALLRALGNARMDDDLPAILPFSSDAQSRVREQVARSLRSFDDPTAGRVLLGLSGDAIPAVERAALGALRVQTLADDDWQALANTVEQGRTSPYSDGALVDLLERRPDASRFAGAMLRYVLARTPQNEGTLDLRARISDMLESPTSP
jgi:hypothetical protein